MKGLGRGSIILEVQNKMLVKKKMQSVASFST